MELTFHSPIPIPMLDDIVHDDEHPLCLDQDCPCWTVYYEAEARAEVAYIERGFMSYSQLPEYHEHFPADEYE